MKDGGWVETGERDGDGDRERERKRNGNHLPLGEAWRVAAAPIGQLTVRSQHSLRVTGFVSCFSHTASSVESTN